MAKLPLEGTRILAMTVVWAGPYGGLMLADWGAEVINVESIRVFPSATRGTFARPSKEMVERAAQGAAGFPNRNPGERPFNRHALFMPLFRNKRSMTVNLNTPEGKDVFRRLVEVSDGLIENNVPGSMARLGLTYDVLSQWNPRFIMVSSSGMGQTGPWSGFRGYGLHFESTFGHNSLFGYPDMGPEGSPSDVAADPAAGVAIAFAFTMALHHRNRTGKGQYIDLAQGENYLPQLGEALMDYSMNGNIRRTIGNRDPTIVQGCYPTMGDDEWITISIATDDHWQDLCNLMGKPELATDERFADSVSRYKHHDEVDEIIKAWTSENDNMWLFYHLQKAKVPSGPVMHEDMAYRCPHLWERRFFLPQTQEDLGMHLYPGTVFKASKMSLSSRRGPVRLGEDNEYVYKDVLKLSDEEYADLEAKGHIGTEYAPEIP
jgi:crotonobetainyl-CoA:carnitine CoA-transferase CaiB-like acyl-CoA transferase